jgi:hypothetical protein
MSKTRYKIRKEQLERVVESFVMESTEGKMIVKDAAKKHKMNMGAEQNDDMGDGMKKAPVSKKHKMKQAPEVKKNIHGKVSESRMAEIKNIMETYGITEDELEEGMIFKTPEELMARGQKIISMDSNAERIYNTIKRDESKYGENSANKYLIFIGKSKGRMLYATWDKGLMAPDKTMGYWIERGKPRSGYDKSTGSGTEL